jgi:hypothetical protein
VVILPIYIFYWKGEWFRDRSKFAKELNLGRQTAVERRRSSLLVMGQQGQGQGQGQGKGRGNLNEKASRHVEQV